MTLNKLLKDRQPKATISAFLGIGEREARKLIQDLSKKIPVISVSTNKGYKIACKRSDYEEAKHTYFELYSRIRELSLRAKPLKHFCAMVEAGATDEEIKNHFDLGE